MNPNVPRVKELLEMIKSRDYFSLILSLLGLVSFSLSASSKYLSWPVYPPSVFFGVALVLFISVVPSRVLRELRRERRRDEIFSIIDNHIAEFKATLTTRSEIRLTDIQEWFPDIPDFEIDYFWTRLKNENVIVKISHKWYIHA